MSPAITVEDPDAAQPAIVDRKQLAAEKKKVNAHLWRRHPFDYYIEEEWCNERLFAVEKFTGEIFDPAVGSGRIVRAARAAGYLAYGADVEKRSAECGHVFDFRAANNARHDNIVCNPPFKHAMEFAMRALERSTGKTAFLLPTRWLCGDKRARWLETTPLRRIYYLTPRPSMPPGPVIEAGIAPGGGKEDFVWLVWLRGYDGKPETGWLRRDP